jgi:hypothetical protein
MAHMYDPCITPDNIGVCVTLDKIDVCVTLAKAA